MSLAVTTDRTEVKHFGTNMTSEAISEPFTARPFNFVCAYACTHHPMAIPDKIPACGSVPCMIQQMYSLGGSMLTPAPVQQVGRGERADPGVSQLTLPNSDSIA